MHELEVKVDDTETTDVEYDFDTPIGTETTDVFAHGLYEASKAKKTIIGYTSMPLSGKSTSIAMANAMGVQSTSMGNVVRSTARMLDTDPWSAARNLRSKHTTEIARRTRGAVSSALKEDGLVIVDGLRTAEELSYYKTQFDEATFVLVEVFCDTSTRLDRYQHRENTDFETAIEELGERDERELNIGLGELLDASDTTIYNDYGKTYTDVCRQTEDVIKYVNGGRQ